MAQCRAHVGQLPFTGVTAHLGHRLGEAEHRTGVAGMTIRQHAPVGIHGFAAAGLTDAAGQPGAALTLATKAEILDLNEQGGGKAVVEVAKDRYRRV